MHVGPCGTDRMVGGSTRWTGEPPPVRNHVPELRQQLERLWPHIEDVVDVWQGMRAIHQTDRLPLAGPIPSRARTWVVAALGSKGLLWGPIAAKATVAHLHEAEPVPAGIGTERISPKRWKLHWPAEQA